LSSCSGAYHVIDIAKSPSIIVMLVLGCTGNSFR
jgi:hypothetical protein